MIFSREYSSLSRLITSLLFCFPEDFTTDEENNVSSRHPLQKNHRKKLLELSSKHKRKLITNIVTYRKRPGSTGQQITNCQQQQTSRSQKVLEATMQHPAQAGVCQLPQALQKEGQKRQCCTHLTQQPPYIAGETFCSGFYIHCYNFSI